MNPIDLVKGVFKPTANRDAVAVGAGALLTNIPQKLMTTAIDSMMTKVVVPHTVRYYNELCRHLQEHAFKYLSNSLSIDLNNRASLSFGVSYSRLLGTPVQVQRIKEPGDSKGENLHITFLFLSKEAAMAKVEEFSKSLRSDEPVLVYRKRIDIYRSAGKDYDYIKSDYVRPAESVFMDPNTLAYINSRIDKFLERKAWYLDRGIPYKYALLLHGVPGTGKTTLAKYIAGRLGRSLFILKPCDITYHVSRMERMVALMEDMDTDLGSVGDRGVGPQGDGFMLGDLLNAIDGVNCVDNCVLIGTTNHLSKIDPALVRKGRFDDVIEIKPLETPEIKRMVSFFFDRQDLAGWNPAGYEPMVGAVVQDVIMNHYDEGPEAVIEQLNQNYSRGMLKKPTTLPAPQPKAKKQLVKKKQTKVALDTSALEEMVKRHKASEEGTFEL